MSEPKRDEKVALRELPPVPPVVWPERLSQTLARYLNRCPRAAYLYVATGGSAPTLEMDRGTLAHAGNALLMVRMLQHGEMVGQGDEALSAFTAEIVREAGEANPHLWVSHEQRDIARLAVFHTAIGLDVDPAHVAGIERKFVLELDCGWTVSGIIDLASMPTDTRGQVDDYKTSLHVPAVDEWDWFQCKLYAAMLVFGRPVERVPCPQIAARRTGEVCGSTCGQCRGRGWVEEVAERPIGGHLREVLGREIFPRHDPRNRADGKLAHVCLRDGAGEPRAWTRMELQELVIDLNDMGERLSEMLTTWKFPARYGTKACNECPAESLCPIPRGYRRFAGHIQTHEEAGEAWAWAQRVKALAAITEREVKAWADVSASSLTVGETTWEHQLTEQTALRKRSGRADWDGFRAALELERAGGEPVALDEWIKTGNVSTFKKVKAGADKKGRDVERGSGAGDGRRDAGVAGGGSAGDRAGGSGHGGDPGAAAGDVEARRDAQWGDSLPE
jgi:hypothetical protein